MDFAFSDRSIEMQDRVRRFMRDYVRPMSTPITMMFPRVSSHRRW